MELQLVRCISNRREGPDDLHAGTIATPVLFEDTHPDEVVQIADRGSITSPGVVGCDPRRELEDLGPTRTLGRLGVQGAEAGRTFGGLSGDFRPRFLHPMGT